MPELPEVEIVKRSLKNKVRYKKIKKVIISNRNLRFKVPKKFENNLKNKSIVKVERFSKYIILILNNKKYCIIHLGMSGTLHLVNYGKKNLTTNLSFYHSRALPIKHNHIKIKFSKFMLVYNDPRRFGFFKILNTKEELKNYFSKYGPEAISNEINYKYLKIKLENKEKNIKNFLLDQNYISGIGNIYANEILFYCKINPQKKSKKVKKKQIISLVKNSKIVLNLAIKLGGSSIRDFKNTSGVSGLFQNEFKVYGRQNKNCTRKNCKGKICKIFISNRSSFFCNICQK